MSSPPRILLWLLERLCPPSRPDLKGDFLEWYEERRGHMSPLRANVSLLLDIISVIPLRFIVHDTSANSPSPFMIFTNLRTARRTLSKNKLYTVINVFGLAVSLTACILITLFVRDELSYDQHFEKKESIVRMGGAYIQGKDNIVTSPAVSWMLLPMMEGRISGVESGVRVDVRETMIEVDHKEYYEPYVITADSTFFDIFSLPLIAGNRETVLDQPTGVVVDRSAAIRLFGTIDAMGKELGAYGKTFRVTGIMEDVPKNTHFRAGIVLPMSGIQDTYPDWVRTNISGRMLYTYLKVNDGFNEANFSAGVQKIISDLWPRDAPKFYVQPITSIHLGPKYVDEVDTSGSKSDVYIFAITALVILVLACINYVNLSIASALPRSKEAGIKKVLGSTNGMLVRQFQTESYLVLIIGSFVALALSWLLLPFFNELTGKTLSFATLLEPFILLSIGAIILFIGLLAGLLPALSILRFGTIGLLSNKLQFKGTKSIFSNVLIVFQFSIAAALIACTLIVTDQIRFIRNRDIGINPNQLVMVPLQLDVIVERFDALKTELLRVPGVTSVSGSTDKITAGVSGWREYMPDGANDPIVVPTINVSHDFFETVGATMASGRTFSRKFPSDSYKSYIINESAATVLGFNDKAVGTRLRGATFNGQKWNLMDAEVVGVVKDFYFSSLHTKVVPVVFSLASELTPLNTWMEIRLDTNDPTTALSAIENVWKQLAPERDFHFEFVDDALNQYYVGERKFLKIFTIFSSLAIVLGGLGLFGLTAFMTKRRTKEIGIRKVVGASTFRLLGILSKDFIVLVAIANLIGWPVAWYFMDQWLGNFAVQTKITAWTFLMTGGAAVAIAFGAILYHSLKVSRANPVDALRSE